MKSRHEQLEALATQHGIGFETVQQTMTGSMESEDQGRAPSNYMPKCSELTSSSLQSIEPTRDLESKPQGHATDVSHASSHYATKINLC